MGTTATLGSFTFEGTEGVEPGSDTGWNREPTISQTRDLGANTDTILHMAAGSHTRSFVVRLPPARFLTLKAIQGTVVTFTDWGDDARSAYVLTVRRESGSRPFLVNTLVELIEQ